MPDRHSSSDEYAARFAGPVGAWFLERQRDSVFHLLKGREATLVLDVGGGHAQIAPHLARAGYQVTVLGSTPDCSKRLKPLLDTNECQFSMGSMLEIPFPDKSFDVVVCLRQLCHVVDWQRLVAELTRVSRKLVIIDYPPRRSFNIFSDLLFQLKRSLEKNSTREYRVFKESEIRTAFRDHGYRVAGEVRQFFLPMVLYRVWGMPRLSQALESLFRMLGLTKLFGSPTIVAMEPIINALGEIGAYGVL